MHTIAGKLGIGLTVLLLVAGCENRRTESVDGIPIYGLFEISVRNVKKYANPFMDVTLEASFTDPNGGKVEFFGFYAGDGKGGQDGDIWKLRFMPDKPGDWNFRWKFSDGSGSGDGRFVCTENFVGPGPWRVDPDNPRWFLTSSGEHFLPSAAYAACCYTPGDWRDAIDWCESFGFNTLVTETFNTWAWASEWPNVTAFETADTESKTVRYGRFNIRMWDQWDQMIQYAGEKGIYIAPFNGPQGHYGGRRGMYPPEEIAYWPANREGTETPENLALMRYLIARQGTFWNLAYWNLGGTEIYHFLNEEQLHQYGERFASLTPFGRMITAQDAEQWHSENRRWMSSMNLPATRKLNTVQTAVKYPNKPHWGKSSPDNKVWNLASVNNEFALDCYGGFPILATEALWEGQGRAQDPLKLIWGFVTAGAHMMWADWRYDYPEKHRYGSIGRGWAPPVIPLDEPLFRTDQLGVDCTGHKQLLIATKALSKLRYWKMEPANSLVAGSEEAYCLAESGKQYVIYAPKGGKVKLDLSKVSGVLEGKWLEPNSGKYFLADSIQGGSELTLTAPSPSDWVLIVVKRPK